MELDDVPGTPIPINEPVVVKLSVWKLMGSLLHHVIGLGASAMIIAIGYLIANDNAVGWLFIVVFGLRFILVLWGLLQRIWAVVFFNNFFLRLDATGFTVRGSRSQEVKWIEIKYINVRKRKGSKWLEVRFQPVMDSGRGKALALPNLYTLGPEQLSTMLVHWHTNNREDSELLNEGISGLLPG